MRAGRLRRGTAEAKAAFERGRGLRLKDDWTGVCAWVAELLAVEDGLA